MEREAHTKMSEVVLGPETAFSTFPAEIELHKHPYYLVKTKEGGYKLLSRICPHAGALVEAESDGFFCYSHGWAFDSENGKCMNAWGGLESHEVEVKDGELVARF